MHPCTCTHDGIIVIPAKPIAPEGVSVGGKGMRRAAVGPLMILYCLGIWLALDFTYSSLTWSENARIANPVFHHTLAANFDGYGEWGDFRHKLVTNNLG